MSAAPAYSAEVRRLFAAQHAGELAGAGDLKTASADLQRGAERILLQASLDGTRLAQLAFRVFGCPHLIAAAEAFCEAFEGQDATAMARFSATETMKKLAIPVEKTGRILLLEDAVRALQASIAAQAP
jgi:NifU-like protein involved in Fe-S cluster formation